MKFVSPEAPPPLALWTSRIAFFSLGLLGAAIFLHRLFSTPTPVALNIIKAAFLGAALAILLSLAAGAQIWHSGRPGTARVVSGLIVGVGLLTWPLLFLPQMRALPAIYDVTTDMQNPPKFLELAKVRAKGAVDYPGAKFARQQADAYPDLKTLEVDRSADESYELVSDALRRQKIKMVREVPPGQTGKGYMEGFDRTLVFGFYDDISVRIEGDGKRSRIDLRSASRYGQHDLGRNAERVRRVLKEVVARLEATVPTASGERVGSLLRRKRMVAKRSKEGDPKTVVPGKAVPGAQSGTQHGPAQKGQPPAKDGGRGRGKRPAQSFE